MESITLSPRTFSTRFSLRGFRTAVFFAASALAVTTASLHGQTTNTVYSSDFSTGTNGWLSSNTAGSLTTSDGWLTSSTDNGQFLTYFNSTTLRVGDSVKVSFDLKMNDIANVDNGLRIGLLDSNNGSKVTADNFGLTNSIFNNYEGYRFITNPDSTWGGRTNIAQRNTPNNNPLGSTWPAALGSTTGSKLTSGQSYEVVINILRSNDTTLLLSFSVGGVSLTDVIAADASTFSFDTLIINKSQATSGGVTTQVASAIFIDNVLITNTVIPEPSQIGAAMALISAIAATVIMRRKRRS